MVDESHGATAAVRRINQIWLDGRVDELASLVHPEIVMVFPGFAGRMRGRDEFIAGFRDFRQSAAVEEFQERDLTVDVVGATAVVTFRYEMVYERSGARYRATGRDFWVLEQREQAWIAVWRTMFDMEENAG
jgi:hypothetical protein